MKFLRPSVIILAMFFATALCAQNSNTPLPRFQAEYSAGAHHIPGSFFALGEGVIRHPDSLNGTSENVGLAIRATKKMYVGVEAFRIIGHGFGRWETKESVADLKEEGISGKIAGDNTMRVDGADVYIKKYFLLGHRVAPFFKIGGGIGKLRFNFNGQLDGVDAESGFPIQSPAYDSYSAVIPIAVAAAGTDIRLTRHLDFTASGFWNTGYGVMAGLNIKF